MVKTSKNLLQNQLNDGLATWYEASGSPVLSRLFKTDLLLEKRQKVQKQMSEHHKISWTVVKFLARGCLNYDLGRP